MFVVRLFLFSFYTFLALLPTEAQVKTGSTIPKGKPQLRFSFTPILQSEIQFEHYGVEHIKSNPRKGYQGIISYFYPVNSKWDLSLGLGLSSFDGCFFYHFSAPLNHSLFQNVTEHVQESCFSNNLLMLPIAVHYRHKFLTKLRISANIEAGISINIHGNPYAESGIGYIHSDQVSGIEIVSFIFQLNKPSPILNPSSFVKFGLVRETPNGNNIFIAFVANYSPLNMRQGKYSFNYLYYDSYGSAKQYFNFLGIEVCYGIKLLKERE